MNNDLNEKVSAKYWLRKMINENKKSEYGPMNSMKVYLFIKDVYMNMSREEKEKNILMIKDLEYDIHYHPETLMKYFAQAYEKKQAPIEPQ